MKNKWLDVTSYRQDDQERVPYAYKIRIDNIIAIKVHRYADCSGWYSTCKELGIEKRKLKSKNIAEAKKEALNGISTVLAIRANKYLVVRDTIEYFLL